MAAPGAKSDVYDCFLFKLPSYSYVSHIYTLGARGSFYSRWIIGYDIIGQNFLVLQYAL